MAAPSIRDVVTQTFNNLTSWDVPLPATVEAGDDLLIGLHIRQEGTITVPDGWEIVSDGVTSANVVSSTVSNRQLWLRKTGGAVGDEDSTTVAVGLGADIADGSSHAFAISGHDPTTPVGVVYAITDEDGGLTYVSPTSIETPRDDCLILHGYAASSNSNNSGFTWSHSTASEITDVRANNRQTMTVASATQATAGAITENVGTADVAGSTVTWGTVVVLVIQPPEAAPEPVTVEAGAGSLAITAQETTVALGSVSIVTGASSLALTAHAASISVGAVSVTTGSPALTIATQAPSVAVGPIAVATGAAALSVNPGAPSVTLGTVTVVTGAAALTLAARAPSVVVAGAIAPGAAVLTITAQPASLTMGSISGTTGAAALSLAAQPPSVTLGAVIVQTGPASLAIVAAAVSLNLGAVTLPTGTAHLSLVANAASVDNGDEEPAPWRPFTATTSLANPTTTVSLAPFRQTVSIGGES
jgi:hypothetical protein